MAEQLPLVVRHLRNVVGGPRVRGLGDAELLRLFAAERDEDAFAALVKRHGGLVLSVCRRVLRHAQDAEDAFQATFLVLARKAAGIRRGASLAAWLHGVAHRIAMSAKRDAIRRQRRERSMPPAAGYVDLEHAAREVQAVLDEEIARLPEKYRAPFVLCCLQGKGRTEAARELGWKEGTLSSRLAEARRRLQKALGRRGIAVGTTLALASLTETAPAAVPALLADATTRAGVAFAGGTAAGLSSAPVVALAEGTLKGMLAGKAKLGLLAVLAVGLIGGVGMGAHYGRSTPATPSSPPAASGLKDGPKPAKSQTQEANQPAVPPRPETGEEMPVRGKVFGPDQKPVAGASIAVLTCTKRHHDGESWAVLRETRSDVHGQFSLTVARTSSARDAWLAVLASSPGIGLGWQMLDVDARAHRALLRLPREQIVHGRLLDLQGQPAAGVSILVTLVYKKDAKGFDSVVAPENLSWWPGRATTDAAGRFSIRGFGPGLEMLSQTRSERFTPERLRLRTGETGDRAAITRALRPARPFEGRVTYADTGQPAADARMNIVSMSDYGSLERVYGRTDKEGRYRLVPFLSNKFYRVTATPAPGQPYLPADKDIGQWPRGSLRQEMNLALPRGVLVRCKITESPSALPVAGAWLEHQARRSNNPFLKLANSSTSGIVSRANGTLQVVLPPGPGHLLIKGPSPDYVHIDTSFGEVQYGEPGRRRLHPDGLVKLDLKPGTATREVTVALRRGIKVEGRLLSPDGKPVTRAILLSPSYVSDNFDLNARSDLPFRNGLFTLPGCDPDKRHTIFALDREHQWGALIRVPAKPASKQPLEVRLAPCGSATVRFVHQDGRPWKNHRLFDFPQMLIELIMTPGAPAFPPSKELEAERALLGGSKKGDYVSDEQTDAEGRCTFCNLIPGATYEIESHGKRLAQFRAKAGQALQLKDIVIERPF